MQINFVCPGCGGSTIEEICTAEIISCTVLTIDQYGECVYGPPRLGGDIGIVEYRCRACQRTIAKSGNELFAFLQQKDMYDGTGC